MSDVIFTTIHGSRLYGFAHEGSDFDYFTVTSGNEKPHQSVVGNIDHVRMGLPAFLERAYSGSHQSVEALFSRKKWWGPAAEMYAPMLSQIRICGPEVTAKYARTITAFCYGDFKRRRHAVRLRLNLNEILRDGQISRVSLDGSRAKLASHLARRFEGDELKLLLSTVSSQGWE